MFRVQSWTVRNSEDKTLFQFRLQCRKFLYILGRSAESFCIVQAVVPKVFVQFRPQCRKFLYSLGCSANSFCIVQAVVPKVFVQFRLQSRKFLYSLSCSAESFCIFQAVLPNVVPERDSCVSIDLHPRVWKPQSCVRYSACGISCGKSKGLCCAEMSSHNYNL